MVESVRKSAKRNGLLAVKTTTLFFFVCLSGCSGLTKEFKYELHQDRWVEIDQRKYEIEIESQKVCVRIDGEWAGWDLVGPFFLPPFIPLPKSNDELLVELSTEKRHEISLAAASIVFDNDKLFESRHVYVRQNLSGEILTTATFLRPSVNPHQIRVEFHGVRFGVSEITIPPLNLYLKTRRCLWYGDTVENVIGCSDWK